MNQIDIEQLTKKSDAIMLSSASLPNYLYSGVFSRIGREIVQNKTNKHTN